MHLRVEHLDDPIGLGDRRPRLSWRLPDGAAEQLASARSHILAADLIVGQQEDRRLVRDGWSEAGFDDAAWDRVLVGDLGFDHLVASAAPPVRAVEELRPVSVTTLAPGRQVFDLGQNINGRVRLSDLGPAGTSLVLTDGEWLDADGDVTTDHLAPLDMPFIDRELRAGMVDRVTSAGRPGDVFDPRFTTHGFQYVRVEGHPRELTVDDLTGVVVHTDLKATGLFACSADRVNALHRAAVWSFRDNACDIPTDCPTRERAGWTCVGVRRCPSGVKHPGWAWAPPLDDGRAWIAGLSCHADRDGALRRGGAV